MNNALFGIIGINVFENRNLVVLEQFRFPKSKRRRIRDKWAARVTNSRWMPDPNVYRIDGNIIGHPAAIYRLRKRLEKKGGG
jgi:hypothetical protein